MVEGLGQLVELQRLDDRLAALQEERSAFAVARAAAEEERKASAERVAAAAAALERVQAEQREDEARLQDQEALVTRLEGQQSQVKTNAAYTAMLHEIERARGTISELETRILEHMEAIEAATRGLAEAEGAHRELEARFEREESARKARSEEIDASERQIGGDRAACSEKLPPPLISQYERAAQRRRPAVVVVSQELCMGCRVGIPPQQYLHLLSGEQIVTCNTCRRILIAERHVAQAAPSEAR